MPEASDGESRQEFGSSDKCFWEAFLFLFIVGPQWQKHLSELPNSCLLSSLYPQQYIPYRHDVAYFAEEDEEMEHGVHILALVQRVEHRTGDVGHAFGDKP